MESRAISDGQISASTEYHKEPAAAIQGRLHFQASLKKIGAWAAAKSNTNQWLQIDLIGPFIRVTRVATQGRNSLVSSINIVNQWVTRYKLQFSNDVASFQFYKEQGQNEAKVNKGG